MCSALPSPVTAFMPPTSRYSALSLDVTPYCVVANKSKLNFFEEFESKQKLIDDVVFDKHPKFETWKRPPPLRGVVRRGERGVARVAPKPLELQLTFDQGASYSVVDLNVLESFFELRHTSAVFLTVVVVDTSSPLARSQGVTRSIEQRLHHQPARRLDDLLWVW